MKKNLVIHDQTELIDGFEFHEGYASWTNDDGVKCATTGFGEDGYIDISQKINGEWKLVSSEYSLEVLEAIEYYFYKEYLTLAYIEAAELRSKGDLFISDETLFFQPKKPCRNSPGNNNCCCQSVYSPEAEGIYIVWIEAPCGLGLSRFIIPNCSIEVMSRSKYEELLAESNRIEAKMVQS